MNSKCPKGYAGKMQIISILDVPALKSILVYGKTLHKISEDADPDEEFDHCGFTGPGTSNEEEVHELIRYSYDRTEIESLE